jgi:hypothetical protein
MAELKHNGAGHVADAGGRFDVGGVVVGIVAELLHQRDVERIRVHGQNIDERTVGGVADGLFLVGQGSLGAGTAQCAL